MKGPYPSGTWISDSPVSQWDWERTRLVRGHKYKVVKSFVDAHGDRHSVGEEWLFITTMFSKFDDELILCVRTDAGDEWTISLRWKPGLQEEIIENFSDYVSPVERR